MTARYSVTTWDSDRQAFTPQEGLTVPSQDVGLWALKRALQELRRMGYSAHYRRDPDGEHDNDCAVQVERTTPPLDGPP